jgi:hypothetical protein
MTTPKAQKTDLWEHVKAMHRYRQRPGGAKPSWTLAKLQRWHAEQHHRYGSRSHFLVGVNLGPDQRPDGWYTGKGVVRIGGELGGESDGVD